VWISGYWSLWRALQQAFKQNGVFLTIKIKLLKNNWLNFFEDSLTFLFALKKELKYYFWFCA